MFGVGAVDRCALWGKDLCKARGGSEQISAGVWRGALRVAPARQESGEACERDHPGFRGTGSDNHIRHQPSKMALTIHNSGVLLPLSVHYSYRVSGCDADALFLCSFWWSDLVTGISRQEIRVNSIAYANE